MFEQLLTIIPPEALATILTGALFGGGYLFRKWFLNKLENERAKLKQLIDDAESKRKLEQLEMQNQLDQTQSSREMLRLQSSEQVENRNAWMKVIEAMRGDAQKRDLQHEKYLGEITEAFRGMQSNTAATLELLKQHAESDEAMAIGQTKVINQNETTHQKLSDLSSELAEVSQKLESIAVGRTQDRKIFDEVREKLDSAIASIKHIEEVVTAPKAVTVTETQATIITESTKEFPTNSDESEKE